MTGYLVDTTVLSALRKGARCDPGVAAWFDDRAHDEIFLSVLTVGELERGVMLVERRDPAAAHRLRSWLGLVTERWSSRILPVDPPVATWWAHLMTPDPLPVVDALIAATALRHDLTLATRNTRDVERSGVRLVNPFSG